MVHRVNLTDKAVSGPEIEALVGSKSGIAILDSASNTILLPLGSSVEVDFWIFGDNQVVVTHNNPKLSRLAEYPTLEQYLHAWNQKRAAEVAMGVRPGIILANLKTHGSEEAFLERARSLGVPSEEIVLLDQEFPATDRLLREKKFGATAPLSLRISRTESFESVLLTLRQPETFSVPRAVFLDPVGEADSDAGWSISREAVGEMYRLAPTIEFILCCPSRWGRRDRIPQVAAKLRDAEVRTPIVMTDIDLFSQWNEILNAWK
jgi:hypothetical protein